MPKTVTLRIDNNVYRIFANMAKAAKRSLSNYIEVAALEYAKEAVFADENEMNEILSNRSLIRRLRRGSRQAKAMKGRFVA